MNITDFVGNEENYVFKDKDEAYDSFALVLKKQLKKEKTTDKDSIMTDAEGTPYEDCVKNGHARTLFFKMYIKECTFANISLFEW